MYIASEKMCETCAKQRGCSPDYRQLSMCVTYFKQITSEAQALSAANQNSVLIAMAASRANQRGTPPSVDFYKHAQENTLELLLADLQDAIRDGKTDAAEQISQNIIELRCS